MQEYNSFVFKLKLTLSCKVVLVKRYTIYALQFLVNNSPKHQINTDYMFKTYDKIFWNFYSFFDTVSVFPRTTREKMAGSAFLSSFPIKHIILTLTTTRCLIISRISVRELKTELQSISIKDFHLGNSLSFPLLIVTLRHSGIDRNY